MSAKLGLATSEPTAIDPVCGTTVPLAAPAGGSYDYCRITYHFCHDGCRRKFVADPLKFLSGTQESIILPDQVPRGSGRFFHCSSCPTVRTSKPGDCPSCGQLLRPTLPALFAPPDPELSHLTLRLSVAILFGIPLLAAPLIDAIVPGQPLQGQLGRAAYWIGQCWLATPIVCWSGAPAIIRMGRSIRRRAPDSDTLIGGGILLAFAISLAALLTAILELRGPFRGCDPLFVASAWAVIFELCGRVFELRMRHKIGDSLRALVWQTPATACVVGPDERESVLPLDWVVAGDLIRVRPGDPFPVDGVIRHGWTMADEGILTGDSTGVPKPPGAAVLAGTWNGPESVTVTASAVGAETVLAHVIHLVAQAEQTRLPLQTTIDRGSIWFVQVVFLNAVLTFVGWMWFGPIETRFATGLGSAITVLVIASPWALSLVTPIALGVGLGRATSRGILFRDAVTLQRLAAVDTLVVDKTGTLTEAMPVVVDIEPMEGYYGDDVLRYAAAVERGSEHPLGTGVLAAAVAGGLDIPIAAGVQSFPGLGIRGYVRGREVLVGNPGLFDEHGVEVPWAALSALRTGGRSVVLVAVDRVCRGMIAQADPIRPSTPAAIAGLRADGVTLILLSGDHAAAAEAVAATLGIDEVISGSLPADKRHVVETLVTDGRIVAVCGNGTHDTPALTVADVGIALGTGRGTTTAGVTLIRPDLLGVLTARMISRQTLETIQQNLWLTVGFNTFAIPVAAGFLVPFAGTLAPAVAVAGMTLCGVAVILNSLRQRS